MLERDEADVDAGLAQQVELGRGRRLVVDADDRAGRQPEPGRRQGAVRHAAAEPPAARVVVGEVARRRADDDDDRRDAGRRPSVIGRRARVRSRTAVRYWPSIPSLPDRSRRVLLRAPRGRRGRLLGRPPRPRRRDGARGLLRARPDDPPPVQDTYEDDTLIEAIAVELEREHGFIFVSDERLTAAVNVSPEEEENFLADIDADDDELDDERGADYRAIVAEFDPEGEPGRPN